MWISQIATLATLFILAYSLTELLAIHTAEKIEKKNVGKQTNWD
jgi:hypothetical protein